jgi:phosphinothricin acetyltransferase
MLEQDWPRVSEIYSQGIATGTATFQTEVPTYAQWDATHITSCRLVICGDSGLIIGWAALSPVSSRCAYRGVAEVSIYVAQDFRGKGYGKLLLDALVAASEEHGYWTLQSVVLVTNTMSISLHQRCGFRIIGHRERISMLADGSWCDTLLLERRSAVVGI